MTGNYANLDTDFGPVPFHVPPLLCGEYEIVNQFGTKMEYTVRYMPRRAKYAGRFGLFYYDPDAHDQLIGVWYADSGWKCVQTVYTDKFEYFLFMHTDAQSKVLVKAKCAWCGKELHDRTHYTHMTDTCNKLPSHTVKEPEVMPEATAAPVVEKSSGNVFADVGIPEPEATTLLERASKGERVDGSAPPINEPVAPARPRKDSALVEDAKANKRQIIKLSVVGKYAGASSADVSTTVGPKTAAKVWALIAVLMDASAREE